MGIVNVTPDSFSDGGNFLVATRAIEHALKLAENGADILDIGGESTRPGADAVDLKEELKRVIPVIEGIRKSSNVPISIDTNKAPVAREAIEVGADMINDISAGRFDGEIFEVARVSEKPICLMHMKGTPRNMQNSTSYNNLLAEIANFLEDSAKEAVKAGIGADNVILDPGIGFGKSPEDNLDILRNLSVFKKIGYPLLVGASRKSFIGSTLDLNVKERLEATLGTIPASIEGGADILRLHDVLQAKRFLDMYYLLR